MDLSISQKLIIKQIYMAAQQTDLSCYSINKSFRRQNGELLLDGKKILTTYIWGNDNDNTAISIAGPDHIEASWDDSIRTFLVLNEEKHEDNKFTLKINIAGRVLFNKIREIVSSKIDEAILAYSNNEPRIELILDYRKIATEAVSELDKLNIQYKKEEKKLEESFYIEDLGDLFIDNDDEIITIPEEVLEFHEKA